MFVMIFSLHGVVIASLYSVDAFTIVTSSHSWQARYLALRAVKFPASERSLGSLASSSSQRVERSQPGDLANMGTCSCSYQSLNSFSLTGPGFEGCSATCDMSLGCPLLTTDW